ncbi:DeoR family transcriptional regulator [Paracerasibacillus soli]|uniref:DeoR family transcriptional regulator n=1 Tax=Paracerasibacillus soli TaxID=480284 RepID=A0ABU5CQY3_9BACI|nr:DeoR family transcriptional regulator [Virgibacillus soli]MDY0408787.1 DeoR family transcriptional regulator [Virgibacillus soli]
MKKLTSTKEKLLVILKKGNKMTIEDIMIHFSVSEIAVRKHLNELVREGFIKKRTVKQKIGRPFYEYELTKKAIKLFPINMNNYR